MRFVVVERWHAMNTGISTSSTQQIAAHLREAAGATGERIVGEWQFPSEITYNGMTVADRGSYIYRSQCSSCHTTDGFNAMTHLVRGWQDREYGVATLRNLHISKPFMPPFVGTEQDYEDLVDYAGTLSKAKLIDIKTN